MIQKLRESANDGFRSADYEKAETILRRVLKISEDKYGTQYRWREETVERLGVCCSKQGKWEDAELFFLEILPESQTEKQSFEITHSLAEVYLGMGDSRRAEIFCKKAIERRSKLFGKEHGLYYRSITLLVQIYETNGDPIGAESCRSLLPLNQFNPQRVEIERLSSIKAEDAAAEIGVTALEHLLPEKCHGRSAKWAEIRTNILKARRISGSGHGYCLLHAVAKYGDEEALIILLEKGANVNAVDAKGNTGLHLAAKGVAKNRKKIVEILLGHGADPSIQRKNGLTALMTAIRKHNSDVIGVLLQKRMDLDVRDGMEWSALHYAASAGDEVTTSILLRNGANVDLTGGHGRTALHCASLGGNEMIVRILLENKADVKHKDGNGQTAADLAKKRSYNNIVALLRTRTVRSLLSGSTW
jgi:tetratricopeptide (TPR) repeat protein